MIGREALAGLTVREMDYPCSVAEAAGCDERAVTVATLGNSEASE